MRDNFLLILTGYWLGTMQSVTSVNAPNQPHAPRGCRSGRTSRSSSPWRSSRHRRPSPARGFRSSVARRPRLPRPSLCRPAGVVRVTGSGHRGQGEGIEVRSARKMEERSQGSNMVYMRRGYNRLEEDVREEKQRL